MNDVTTGRYSAAARVLHWLSAAVIIWALITGVYITVWAGPEARKLIAFVNVSVTTLFIPVFALRAVYALVSKKPGPLSESRYGQVATRTGHFVLYALSAAVLVSGVLMMEQDIRVFDWVAIPQPLDDPGLNRLFGRAHRITSVLLGVTICAHIAAVIRHERRGVQVLSRMT